MQPSYFVPRKLRPQLTALASVPLDRWPSGAAGLELTVYTVPARTGTLHTDPTCRVNRTGRAMARDRMALHELAMVAADGQLICACLTTNRWVIDHVRAVGWLVGVLEVPDVTVMPDLVAWRNGRLDPSLNDAIDRAHEAFRATFDPDRWQVFAAAVGVHRLVSFGKHDSPVWYGHTEWHLTELLAAGVHPRTASQLMQRWEPVPSCASDIERMLGELRQPDRLADHFADQDDLLAALSAPFDATPVWCLIEAWSTATYRQSAEVTRNGESLIERLDAPSTVTVTAAPQVVWPASSASFGPLVQLPAGMVEISRGPQVIADGEVPRSTIELAAVLFNPSVHRWFGDAVDDARLLDDEPAVV